MVTMEERVTQLERTSDATLEILKSHGEALARLDAKIDARFDAVSARFDAVSKDISAVKEDVSAVKEEVSAVKEDVAWIRQRLG